MDRQQVSSSIIESIGYDSDTAVLEIEFTSGATYSYYLVPPSVHAGLQRAASKGRFYGEFIRGSFRYVRHSEERRVPER